MKNPLARVAKKIERFNWYLYIISSAAILLSALILTYEVVMRYILKTPTIWEIEASIYLMIMASFLGAAYGLRDGSHINIDLITRLLPSKFKAKLSVITSLLSFFFCLLMAWKGWEMWWEAFSKGWRSESVWGFPLAVPYLFLPLGMTLLSLQYMLHISGVEKAKEPSRP